MQRRIAKDESVLRAPGARRCPLLAQLTARHRRALVRSSWVVQCGERDVLSTSSNGDAVEVVLDGVVFEQVRHPGGRGVYGRPVAAGEVLGLTDVLASTSLDRQVRALLPSTTLHVPGDLVRRFAADGDVGAAAVAATSLRLLRTAESDRVVLASGDATGRVLRRLGELVATWGRRTTDGVDIVLPLTQGQLGAWAGSSRETTVRVLHQLRARGLVETSRRHLLVVDPQAVDVLAAEHGVLPTTSTRWSSPAGAFASGGPAG